LDYRLLRRVVFLFEDFLAALRFFAGFLFLETFLFAGFFLLAGFRFFAAFFFLAGFRFAEDFLFVVFRFATLRFAVFRLAGLFAALRLFFAAILFWLTNNNFCHHICITKLSHTKETKKYF